MPRQRRFDAGVQAGIGGDRVRDRGRDGGSGLRLELEEVIEHVDRREPYID